MNRGGANTRATVVEWFSYRGRVIGVRGGARAWCVAVRGDARDARVVSSVVVVVVVARGARAQTRDAEASVRANMRARETAARRNGRVMHPSRARAMGRRPRGTRGYRRRRRRRRRRHRSGARRRRRRGRMRRRARDGRASDDVGVVEHRARARGRRWGRRSYVRIGARWRESTENDEALARALQEEEAADGAASGRASAPVSASASPRATSGRGACCGCGETFTESDRRDAVRACGETWHLRCLSVAAIAARVCRTRRRFSVARPWAG